MLPLWVAKDKKLFEKHRRRRGVTYIRGVAIEAMLAGEVRLRPRVAAPPRPSLRGADLAIIANTINVAVFSMMTKPETRKPETSKAKRSASPIWAILPDLVLSLLLERWGFQRNKDVTFLASVAACLSYDLGRKGIRRWRA